ncbi:hypothetical protein [Streptomyces sp. NPDC001604]|uniref:hypothetical protein n=1 Tax=Streptomyces sp. NPDC001604 TaxID=3364593 RepID=UPI0036A83DDE
MSDDELPALRAAEADDPALAAALSRSEALAAERPGENEQVYELFDESGQHCNPLLPVQRSVDRFTFVDLVTLARGKRPVTLPLYRTFDADDLRGIGEPVRRALVDAAPLLDTWEVPEQLREPRRPVPEVRVPLGRLLRERSIPYGEDRRPVKVTPERVRQLLQTGRADFFVREGDEDRHVIVIADGLPGSRASDELVVPVADVASFLASPELPDGGTVELTDDEIGLLSAGQPVELTREVGDRAVQVRLVPATTGRRRTWGGARPVAALFGDPPAGKGTSGEFDPTGGKGGASELPLPSGYEFVLWCPYRQVWTLLGYTRGELLSSIPLAPQEETTIEIFSWDRRVVKTETTMADESENTATTRQTTKDSTQVVREAQRQRHWDANGDGHINLNINKVVSIGGSAGGTIGKQLDDTARRTSDNLVEAVDEAVQRVKSTRQTVVTETSEVGSETRVTRKLRNLNMTRTLTFDYFEVLATYKVESSLSKPDIRLCVLTDDLLPGDINRYFVLHHEGALRGALLAEQYEAGFDAVRLLATFEATCAVACAPECACEASGGPCACEPADTGPTPEVPADPGGEPASGDTFCLPLPLTLVPGHGITVCRNAAGQISVRMSGPLFSGPLAGEGDGFCFRFPIPVPLPVPPPPFFGYVGVCLRTDGTYRIVVGVGVWFFGFQEIWSKPVFEGALTAPPTPAPGKTPADPGAPAGGCCGCDGDTALTLALGALADAVTQLEVATLEALSFAPADGAWQAWTQTLHTYLYRRLALETACPTWWGQLQEWARRYRPDRPQLSMLRRALRVPRDRIVTAAMLPHAMLGEYTRVIREIAQGLGFPRSELVTRGAGFYDQGFEAALADAQAALAEAAQRCGQSAGGSGDEKGSGSGSGGVAGAPLGSGNWSIGELAKRLLNPILWAVEKAYEGYTTDEAPPDLSFIEKGGIGAALTAAAVRIARDGPLPTHVRGYPVQRIAEAVVLEQQLLAHLSANESHYRQAVWSALDAGDRYNLLSARGDRLLEFVENDILGFVGRKALLPFRLEAAPDIARWFTNEVVFSDTFVPAKRQQIETVPTNGLHVQPRLGPCDTGESFVMDLRAAEVRARRADAAAAEHRAALEAQEVRRRKLRLDRTPPDLGDPVERQGPVRLDIATHDADGGAAEPPAEPTP